MRAGMRFVPEEGCPVGRSLTLCHGGDRFVRSVGRVQRVACDLGRRVRYQCAGPRCPPGTDRIRDVPVSQDTLLLTAQER
jgi:hypothetical protein